MKCPTRSKKSAATLMLAICAAAAAPAMASATSPLSLVSNQVQEGSLAGGEEVTFLIHLTTGTPWRVTADQEGVDLVLSLAPPGSGPEVTVDSPLGRYDPEILVIKPAISGPHQIRLRPSAAQAVRGRFRLDVRPFSAHGKRSQRQLLAAQTISAAGEQFAQGTPEARRQAADTYESALGLWRQLDDRRGQALALTALGALARQRGEARLALDHLGEALVLWRTEGDQRRTAITLNDLGLSQLELGERGAAAEFLAEAAALQATIGEVYGEAVARNNLCLLQLSNDQPEAARPCFQRVIALFATAGERRVEALARSSLAGALDQLGEPSAALEELERAYGLMRALGDRRGQARLLANRAALFRRLGEPRAALADYGQVVPLLRALDDQRRLARTLNNLGFAYLELGDPERARSLLEESLAMRRAVGDRLGESVTYNNLGQAYQLLSEPAAAVRAHRQAEVLLGELGDEKRLATTHSLLGGALLDLGEPRAALVSFERALMLEGKHGAQRRRRGHVLGRLARAHLRLGDAEAALRHLDEALPFFRALHDREGEAQALVVMAQAQHALGHLEPALATVDHALAYVESQRQRVAGPRLQATFFDAWQRGYELRIEILMARHRADPLAGFAARALATAERSRARVLRDLLAASDVPVGIAPALRGRRRDLLRRLRAQTSRRLRLNDAGRGDEAKAAAQEVVATLVALDALDAEIERDRPGYTDLTAGQPFDLARLQADLGDAVLLAYALGETLSYVWVVTADSLEAFELPPRARLEAAAQAAYLQLRTLTVGTAAGNAVREMADLILAPAHHRLTDQRLVIVPDGALHYLPFGALPGPHGQPLAIDHEVVHLPAATLLTARRRRVEVPNPSIAVLADPVFNRDDPRLQDAPRAPDDEGDAWPAQRLPRLLASRQEATAITAAAPPGNVDVALGFDANLDAFRAGHWRHHRILHLATHGVIDGRDPELSGAVLSRYDAQGHERNGFLGLHELYDLRLEADLVVLSGCQTAFGRALRGEGMVGLTQGFLYAGAQQVVATLWQVEDRVAAAWMAVFYRELLQQGRSPAAALRAAQLEIRSQRRWRDPFYWAAFVLIGDERLLGRDAG